MNASSLVASLFLVEDGALGGRDSLRKIHTPHPLVGNPNHTVYTKTFAGTSVPFQNLPKLQASSHRESLVGSFGFLGFEVTAGLDHSLWQRRLQCLGDTERRRGTRSADLKAGVIWGWQKSARFGVLDTS